MLKSILYLTGNHGKRTVLELCDPFFVPVKSLAAAFCTDSFVLYVQYSNFVQCVNRIKINPKHNHPWVKIRLYKRIYMTHSYKFMQISHQFTKMLYICKLPWDCHFKPKGSLSAPKLMDLLKHVQNHDTSADSSCRKADFASNTKKTLAPGASCIILWEFTLKVYISTKVRFVKQYVQKTCAKFPVEIVITWRLYIR